MHLRSALLWHNLPKLGLPALHHPARFSSSPDHNNGTNKEPGSLLVASSWEVKFQSGKSSIQAKESGLRMLRRICPECAPLPRAHQSLICSQRANARAREVHSSSSQRSPGESICRRKREACLSLDRRQALFLITCEICEQALQAIFDEAVGKANFVLILASLLVCDMEPHIDEQRRIGVLWNSFKQVLLIS